MSEVIPAFAAVRPRVSCLGVFERRLLEEVIVEYTEENPRGLLLIEGMTDEVDRGVRGSPSSIYL